MQLSGAIFKNKTMEAEVTEKNRLSQMGALQSLKQTDNIEEADLKVC
jgi:hypothetical protein